MPFQPDKLVELDHELSERLYLNTFMSQGTRGLIGGVDTDTGQSFGYEIAIDPAMFTPGALRKANTAAVTTLLNDLNKDGALATAVQSGMTILPDHEIYDRLKEMASAPPDMGADFKAAAEAAAPRRPEPGITTVALGKIGR
jgi:hypothetical protein